VHMQEIRSVPSRGAPSLLAGLRKASVGSASIMARGHLVISMDVQASQWRVLPTVRTTGAGASASTTAASKLHMKEHSFVSATGARLLPARTGDASTWTVRSSRREGLACALPMGEESDVRSRTASSLSRADLISASSTAEASDANRKIAPKSVKAKATSASNTAVVKNANILTAPTSLAPNGKCARCIWRGNVCLTTATCLFEEGLGTAWDMIKFNIVVSKDVSIKV